MLKFAGGALAALALTGLAQAGEIHPMQATSISLGDVTGVVYYTVADEGFEVVATLAAGENGTRVRVVTTLVSGQRMVVSVPQAVDREARELEFARLGDSVFVTRPQAMMN
jgi:predicted aconitase